LDSYFYLFSGLRVQLKSTEFSEFLKFIMETKNNNFWTCVYVAEALVLNNYKIDVDQIFKTELERDGSEKNQMNTIE